MINYSTSFRTPDDVREEWAGHGVHAFTEEEYTQSLDAVCERLGVNHEHSSPSSRDRAMRDGCLALGWHIDAMPRNVRGCDQGETCGYCGLGCRLGAKQSVTKTWLADAAGVGARLVIKTRAKRVIVEDGEARGVEAGTIDGHRVTVRSRAVVAACGAIQTPALLKRSGLANRNIGQPPQAPPGHGGLGAVRRGDQAVGGHDAGALLRPAPRPARRLRPQVRDRGDAPAPGARLLARGEARASTST